MDLATVVHDPDNSLGLTVACEKRGARPHPFGGKGIREGRPAEAVVVLGVEVICEIEIVHQAMSGRSALAEVDGNTTVVLVEDGHQLQTGTKGFEMVTKGRDQDVFGVLELGDRPLGDIKTACTK